MIANQIRAGLAALLATVLFASNSDAAVTLSLSTTSSLSDLNVGDTISFDVVLSGLPGGSPTSDLGFLGATVVFDGTLLGTPSLPAPGAIVPDLDPLAYVPLAGLGQADASYDFLFAPSGSPITTNGVFFSFDVTAQAAGSGMIGFDSLGTAAFDTSAGPIPVDVNLDSGQTFSISATDGIPEPTSLLVWAALSLTVFAWPLARSRSPFPL